jgi:predicted nucleic acid-binding protein
MAVEPGVLDANVLVYALNVDAPQHSASRSILEAAEDPSVQLYVTSQILCELYSLITNPRRVAAASPASEAVNSFPLANAVHRIWTVNTGDFRIFPELDVLAP